MYQRHNMVTIFFLLLPQAGHWITWPLGETVDDGRHIAGEHVFPGACDRSVLCPANQAAMGGGGLRLPSLLWAQTWHWRKLVFVGFKSHWTCNPHSFLASI